MKRKLALFLLPVFLLGLLTGCGNTESADSVREPAPSSHMSGGSGWYDSGYDNAAADYDLAAEEAASPEMPAPAGDPQRTGTEADTNTSAGELNLKLIYRADMELQTTDYDEAVAGLKALVAQLGGYFETDEQYGYDSSYRSSYYIVRVPTEQFDALCQGAGELCTLVYMNRSIQDVSEMYYDTEARLAVAQTKYDRLLDLLSKADNMSDIIDLETALAETEYEIEELTGSLRRYDSLIGYATVSISLQEVYRVDPDGNAPLTFGERIGQSFHRGMVRALNGVENFFLFIVGHIVGIIIVIVIIVLCVWLLGKLRRWKQNRPPKPPKTPRPPKEKKRKKKAAVQIPAEPAGTAEPTVTTEPAAPAGTAENDQP
ncbi:MAG: DUF4349 domain-containing protein [Oscillospiraceae bacterium]|nr:DUF4349 domain-containing protein [Oscillospiraceae bacterium]